MRAALEFTEAKAKVNSLPGPATVGRRRYTRPSLPANRATLPDTLTLNGWVRSSSFLYSTSDNLIIHLQHICY
uniref:Uncharacterized protein n=1 Tax=Mesocestoides corti TaxID=53468 RepID=A0A5K3FA84_MESCO